MAARPEDEDKIFRESLKNVPKPVNDTSIGPEMRDYLNNLNNGTLKSEETEKKEAELAKRKADDAKYKLFCPTCRKPTLKRAGPNWYACGFCGLETGYPLRMASKEEKD